MTSAWESKSTKREVQMNSKKVLVVGGAGFIGSHVNKMLHQAGYETVVFDNLSRGDERAVTQGTFVLGDMANEQDLSSLFSSHQFDAVMHFAALTDVGESVSHPGLYYTNNVTCTIQLLKHMIQHNVLNFIFSSSAAVYGVPSGSLISENSPCAPINPYGRTKLIVEEILKDFHDAYGLNYCALRYFNAAGGDPDGEIKNYKTKENNLIPLALKSLIEPNGSIKVFGNDYPTPDGTCIRDYIHVMDLGAAHILAMETLLDGGHSDVYNLGNGNGFSVKEVLKAIETVTGRSLNIIPVGRRPGDPVALVADAQKANTRLHWQPRYAALELMILHAWQAMAKECTKCPH